MPITSSHAGALPTGRLPLYFAAGCAASAFLAFTIFYYGFRQAFFDDVFIYLHVARNGVDAGTWQYFTIVDRPALLASSPLKIVLLTIAAGLTKLLGAGERTFADAKLILIVYAPLAWILWLPFWRGRPLPFLWLGTLYFLAALALTATVDFEGGLLFMWVATLAMLLSDARRNSTPIAWALPIGFLIRPDVALPIVLATLTALESAERWRILRVAVSTSLAFGAAWTALALLMNVWPVPVTYWTKAAAGKLVEDKYMIESFFERIGWVVAPRILHSAATATAVGILVIVGFLLAVFHGPRARICAAVALVTSVSILSRLPASFWWYYQNAVLALLGIAVGLLLRHWLLDHRPLNERSSAAIGTYTMLLCVLLAIGTGLKDGPALWSMAEPSRSQGYMYLASRALGNGTYDLPGIGKVFIKNPEMGIANFFAGDRAWIWDSAGLAQPLDDPKVTQSRLRLLFPSPLHRSAREDATALSDIANLPLRVVEVWAMENRDFDAASKACRYVIREGAICANDFLIPDGR